MSNVVPFGGRDNDETEDRQPPQMWEFTHVDGTNRAVVGYPVVHTHFVGMMNEDMSWAYVAPYDNLVSAGKINLGEVN